MTEKRFTIDKDGITVIDNCTDGLTECKYSNEAKLLCNFLNELAEENEELKSKYSEQCIQLDFLKDENQHMRNLVNENKQLKDGVYDWKAIAEDYFKLGKSLKKENEQLKQENKKLKEQLKDCTKKAKEEIRKQEEENAIRWANIGR